MPIEKGQYYPYLQAILLASTLFGIQAEIPWHTWCKSNVWWVVATGGLNTR